MSAVQSLVASPFAAALGWTLIHSLWEGLVISAALLGALSATRSARARYALASGALLGVVVCFGVTLLRFLPAFEGSLQSPIFARSSASEQQMPFQSIDFVPSGVASLIPWLGPLWLAGVVLFYLRDVAAWMAMRRFPRKGVCSAGAHWDREVARLAGLLKVSRPVVLLESCLADVPLVLGHFRPLILMPAGLLTGLPHGQIEAILLHELAHIRRCDYLLNLLQRCMEDLLFYHPAVWWISRVIRAEREHCCDDEVVGVRGEAHEYARALAVLENKRSIGRQPAVAATGGILVRRIHRLLYPKRAAAVWTPAAAGLILISTAAVAFGTWKPESPKPAPVVLRDVKETPDKYSEWLNQDVVYIITQGERSAYEKLTADDERDHFIKQFWERRGAAFKQEHYRRLAYANDHYASSKPGWQTDRGHMYIVYGPPDEIEAHPSGEPNALPYEDWKYRHIDGVGDDLFFKFVDRSGEGDYALAPAKSR